MCRKANAPVRHRTITIVKKRKAPAPLQTCPYAVKRHRSDSEPGGDVMLRHPPDNFRTGPQQFLVALLRRVPDARQEELLITVEAVNQFLLISTSEPWTLPDEPVEVIPAHGQELGRLDALQREQTGLAPVHAVERGHKVPFEKKLESAVL